ncbi:MAG: F0F1 ATP synthase subunit delta [Acidimicrobiales bacterium]
MLEKVLGYTDAVLDDLGQDIAGAAAELTAFVDMFRLSEDLRAVFLGGVASVPVRRSIVAELLEGKVRAQVVDLLSFAVQGGSDADYEADVAGVAAAAVAKRDGMVRLEEGPLGRTAAAARLDGYATAVLARTDRRGLGEVEDELFRFMRIIGGNDELLGALTTSEVPVALREGVVHDLLSRRASTESERMAVYAARVGRPRDYLVLLEGLLERVASEADRRVADVRSAVELTPSQRDRLAAAISRYTGYQVEVKVTLEPDLLGGFVAYVGDTVLDTSIRQRLRQAHEVFLAPPAERAK